MPHHDHDHDHDHDSNDSLGFKDNLYAQVDRQNVVALNALGSASDIIKPWHARLDEDQYLQSDSDDQMIIRVPFTETVRLRAVLIKAGPGDQTPAKVSLFANEPTLDFDDVGDKTATQEFFVPQHNDVGEYPVKTAKFSNISAMTLFVPASQGASAARIYYLGFLGSFVEQNNKPVIAVYETQANLADHEKIQGMDNNWSSTGY